MIQDGKSFHAELSAMSSSHALQYTGDVYTCGTCQGTRIHRDSGGIMERGGREGCGCEDVVRESEKGRGRRGSTGLVTQGLLHPAHATTVHGA